MKYLISTTGSKFPFMLNAEKKFVFDPISAVPVEDDDLPILVKRLGVNIKEVTIGKPSNKKVDEEKPTEMSADEDGEAKDEE